MHRLVGRCCHVTRRSLSPHSEIGQPQPGLQKALEVLRGSNDPTNSTYARLTRILPVWVRAHMNGSGDVHAVGHSRHLVFGEPKPPIIDRRECSETVRTRRAV